MNNSNLKNRKSKREFTPHITSMKLFRGFISGRGKLCGGFTIVELLVAMSIFIVLTTIATGAFIQALRSERRLLALMSVTNNVSLVLEQMTREIRTGYLFSGGVPNQSSCANGATLTFESSAAGGGSITYSLKEGKIERNGKNATASNVNVENLCFIVTRGQNVCNPWRVTILSTVNALPIVETVSSITLQTTASSRVLPKEVPRAAKSGTEIQYCD